MSNRWVDGMKNFVKNFSADLGGSICRLGSRWTTRPGWSSRRWRRIEDEIRTGQLISMDALGMAIQGEVPTVSKRQVRTLAG